MMQAIGLLEQGSSLSEMDHTISVVTGIKSIENLHSAELQTSTLRAKQVEIIPLNQQSNLG